MNAQTETFQITISGLPAPVSELNLRAAEVAAKRTVVILLQQQGELTVREAAAALGCTYEQYLALLAERNLSVSNYEQDPVVLQTLRERSRAMIAGTKKSKRSATKLAVKLPKLVREEIHGVVIEYYPLGEHVVIQPGVQGGLPTIKNTRITAGVLVGWVEQGRSPADVAQGYRIPVAAVEEALALASKYDYDRSYA